MLAFWPEVIGPMLAELAPRSIVEIGSESGKTTARLLELARSQGARVHAIDPSPQFDVEAVRRQYDDCLVLHQARSLDVLGRLEGFDVVLIDGDHNWYTVFHELQLIEARSAELDQPLPLIFLHDVSWPYGRRDLYYDPESIPAEHRQPWARRGISPTASELLPRGGLNASLCNAQHEGGPRNGVRTAVEDYLKQTAQGLQLAIIPAVFGLGILLPHTLAAAKPALAERVGAWAPPEVEGFIERLELARIAMLVRPGG